MFDAIVGRIREFDVTWSSLLWGALLFFVASMASVGIIALVLVHLPVNHFQRNHRQQNSSKKLPFGMHWPMLIARNLLGLCIIALGVFLSLPGIPGQGILTILVGVMVLEFPGKRKIEAKLIGQPRVFGAINRLRCRFGKPPLVLDDQPKQSEPKHNSALHGSNLHI